MESGTCRGNGARGLAKKFARVVTIELSEQLHREASLRLGEEGLRNIEFVLGSSPEALARILPGLPAGEAVFFFLDAHWSGDQSVDWSRAGWKGYGIDTAHLGAAGALPSAYQQCPLAEELRAIMKHSTGPAYVLVDDMKNLPLAGQGLKDHTFAGEDWSHLNREMLLEIVRPRLEAMHALSNPEQWLLVLKAPC